MDRSDFRFCLNFLTDEPIREIGGWWQACEAAGIDYVGVADSPMIARETFVTAAYGAALTSRLGLMTAITNPVSRDPSVMASALFSLDEIAPGRIVCGIGTGDSAVWSVGLQPARVARLGAYVTALRTLLRGGEAEFEGRRFRAAWKRWAPPSPVPVYVACSGPRVLRMGAQLADGLVIFMGFSPASIAYANRIIDEACAEVGRDRGQLDIWWQTTINFAPTVAEALEWSLGVNTSWMTMGSVEGKLIPEELIEPLKRFNADMESVTASYEALDRGRVLVERAKEMGLYDWLISMAPGLWGPPDNVAARLREFGAQGLTNWQFYVAQFHGNRYAYIDQFVNGVLPALGKRVG